MTLQEPAADKVADRPLDGVVFIEVAGMGVKLTSDLWDRQLGRMLVQQERENDALISRLLSDEGIETTGSRVRRVLVSHEELCLLVVRRPVVLVARRVAAFA